LLPAQNDRGAESLAHTSRFAIVLPDRPGGLLLRPGPRDVDTAIVL